MFFQASHGSLHLARLLHRRNISVTFFTTAANRLFISDSLSDTDASIVELPFPQDIEGLPAGVENTEKLPSMSLFVPFANATKLMQPNFEEALETLPQITSIISDGFLWWTQQSATDSYGGPYMDFITKVVIATSKSYGIVSNSFYELEALYVEYCNRESGPKSWCIGPLCWAVVPKTEPRSLRKPTWLQWLDQKLAEGSTVLYVAFGSQAQISSQQLCEIAVGLQESKVNFLWVTRKSESELNDLFQERVTERGLVVREWVDQRTILGHGSVRGFLSHCGWNSVLESICAKVPILAWPMMAEQHLNARMVVEEIKVGLRVETINGSVRGFVKSEGLEKMVRELMEGEMGKEVRKKVEEFGEMAKKAVEEGGSSWHSLNQLINELQANHGGGQNLSMFVEKRKCSVVMQIGSLLNPPTLQDL